MSERHESPVTKAVRAAVGSDGQFGAVMPPLYLSSNYAFEGFDRMGRYDYTRSGNPTRDYLAEALADLEGGAGAVVTASGMSAVLVALQLVPAGGRVVAPHDCYGGTFRLLSSLARKHTFTVDFVDLTDPVDAARALRDPASLVWVETPSNPLLRITEIGRIERLARAAGAVLVVDNTFLSPALQRPLELGADVVVHSTTKYLNGHSDVVGGAVVAADAAVAADLSWWANCLGVTGAPFDSYLTLRGLRTLHARMRCHVENAKAVAAALEDHPAVARVWYPGLTGHPGHAVAAAQQSGPGAIVSFELDGPAAVERFAANLRYFTLAESLGGVESLVAHPATMTHASMTPEARRTAGIAGGLVRLSVGIEAGDDLVADLTAALEGLTARRLTGAATG